MYVYIKYTFDNQNEKKKFSWPSTFVEFGHKHTTIIIFNITLIRYLQLNYLII